MEYDTISSAYKMQACALQNYTCPNPIHMSINYPLQCEYWTDERFWTSSSWEQYYQYTVLGANAACDPYGIISVCDSSKQLVCYCSSSSCTCVVGLKYGEDCSTNPIPCISGYVCSNKICTKMYSVAAGGTATDSKACIGGGPLVVKNGAFVCRNGPTTLGGIPKICITDSDCISDTGSEITQCLCGLNTAGQGYCTLQFSDSPMVNWRQAIVKGNYKLQIYWEFISVNYPYLQGNIDTCLGDVWRDFYQYKLINPNSTSSQEYLKIIFCFYLIIA